MILTPEVARGFMPIHPNELTPVELASVLEAGELLESYIAQVRAHAVLRLHAGKPVEGWELVPTEGRRSIPDTVLAARQLAPLLEPHEILAAAKLSLGAVIDAIKDAEGVTEKEAKAIAADYLKGNIVKGTGSEKLQRAPKTVELHPSVKKALADAGQLRHELQTEGTL